MMTRRASRHRGLALILVMILVVVAGVMGVSYVVSSTVQMVSSNNLLWASRAKYLGESGLEHATWMLRTDPDAPAALAGTWWGAFNADATADKYVFTAAHQGDAVYLVTGTGTADAVSQTASMTLQLTSNYSKLINAQSPICYWRLGESGGTTAVDSASGVNGIYHSVSLGRVGPLAGEVDTAARFNGFSSYVEIPHSDSLLLDNGTVLLWFKASYVKHGGLFSKDSLGRDTGGHLMIETDHGKVEVRFQSRSSDYHLDTDSITAGQWYFVAFTFGGSGMKLYLNAELEDSDNYTGGLGTTSGGAGNYEPIAIGANTKDSYDMVVWPLKDIFAGRIDEVAVLGQALTAEQIGRLYDARIAEATVIAWNK